MADDQQYLDAIKSQKEELVKARAMIDYYQKMVQYHRKMCVYWRACRKYDQKMAKRMEQLTNGTWVEGTPFPVRPVRPEAPEVPDV